MKPAVAHLINHTHWDREWFLTAIYTSRWIPALVEKLEQLVAANPDFRYLFDGQTLVLEDLAAVSPAHEARAAALVRSGRLTVGPYYCQPDWQLTGGELLIRNLLLGQEDVRRYGGAMQTGWLVDTFGHISQAPQIHRLFGIDAVYVWRGVPQLTPYFAWVGSDGSRLFAVDLFGGYRNLYGVTHAPDVAALRLHAEIAKLQPYYPTPAIPLFDGYDLEDNPEDPLTFFATASDIDPAIALRESTPASFAQEMAATLLSLPEIRGELNSGKYGATFPGTFSARTYLKLMAHDCEHLLFQRYEPLAALAWLQGWPYPAESIERWTRLLLQNAVHDCICGVSIDEVHEKMEYAYRDVFAAMSADLPELAGAILTGFAPGVYAVSTTPFAVDQWQAAGDELMHVTTHGIGAWQVTERLPIARPGEQVDAFTWRNDHYTALLTQDGLVKTGDAAYGGLTVYAEQGDTYSAERGAALGMLGVQGPLQIEERSDRHCVVGFKTYWADGSHHVTGAVRVCFDRSPLIRWTIDLDSRGVDMVVEITFMTGISPGAAGCIAAGMPFDIVRRPPVDEDLLPRATPPELASILLGQREVGAVDVFPFHDFVAVTDGRRTAAVLAAGLRAYSADAQGAIRLPLRRSVEWLTRASLRDRVGDAGPFFYVPGARCERTERHEVALVCGEFSPESTTLQALNAAFQNAPLLVAHAGDGARTSLALLREDLPLGSLPVRGGAMLARLYNPTSQSVELSRSYVATDVRGAPAGATKALAPKAIATIQLAAAPVSAAAAAPARLLAAPAWRVAADTARPDTTQLAEMAANVAALETAATAVEQELTEAPTAADRVRRQHRYYVLKRESAEARLSLLLNRRKLVTHPARRQQALYEYDPEIAAVGLELNQLRIKRRIFDYVVAALAEKE